MKKFISLLLVLALAFTLVACKKEETGTTEPDTATETYDIVFLADIGSINDGGFNQYTWLGCETYAKDHGMTVNYLQPADDSDASRATILEQAATEWQAKVVVPCGFLWDTTLMEKAASYPDLKIVFIDGTLTGIDNVAPIQFAEQEVGFLAGYAAVKDGYRELGFLGGMAVPAVIRFGYGFLAGADAAAVELGLAKGDVNMKYWYTGGFDPSPEIATHVAGWYEGGTEIVFSCGGNIVNSAIASAEAGEGRYLIGVDTDESDKSERIVTSAMKDLLHGTYNGIAAALEGGWDAIGGKQTTYGAANNGVQLPDHFDRFNNFTQADYDTLFAKLADDEGGIASSIPTNETNETPDTIAVSVVNLTFEG